MPAIGRSTAPRGSSSNGKLSGSRGSGPEIARERERGVGHGPRQQPSKTNGSVPPNAFGRPMNGTRPNDCLKP